MSIENIQKIDLEPYLEIERKDSVAFSSIRQFVCKRLDTTNSDGSIVGEVFKNVAAACLLKLTKKHGSEKAVRKLLKDVSWNGKMEVHDHPCGHHCLVVIHWAAISDKDGNLCSKSMTFGGISDDRRNAREAAFSDCLTRLCRTASTESSESPNRQADSLSPRANFTVISRKPDRMWDDMRLVLN